MCTHYLPRAVVRSVAALVVMAALAACGEDPAGSIPFGPTFDAAIPACPAGDVAVSSWAELLDALAAATPGTVVAVAGTISVEHDFDLPEGVTLTCAAPGAGLRVAEGAEVGWLLNVRAPDVTVTGLVLDATGTIAGGGVFGFWDGIDAFGERTRIANNTVRCGSGPDECIVLLGGLSDFAVVSGGSITENQLQRPGTGFGIHVQGFRDVAVERNIVNALDAGPEAGIAVNLSRGVALRDNVVTGPWTRSVWLFDNADSTLIVGNRLSGATELPILAQDADAVQMTDNAAACSQNACAQFEAASDALVSRNRFQAAGPVSGVHFQLGIDGTRVLNNRIVTTAPSTNPAFGGIRIRDGSAVVVAGNSIEGPWANGVAADVIVDGTLERNVILRPGGFGLSLAMDGGRIARNRVSGAGGGGLHLRSGCFNTITANALFGNDPGVLFDGPTGANTFSGDRTLVVDLGDFDCDGDGSTDPNQIQGPAVSGAAPSGPPTAQAVAGEPLR